MSSAHTDRRSIVHSTSTARATPSTAAPPSSTYSQRPRAPGVATLACDVLGSVCREVIEQKSQPRSEYTSRSSTSSRAANSPFTGRSPASSYASSSQRSNASARSQHSRAPPTSRTATVLPARSVSQVVPTRTLSQALIPYRHHPKPSTSKAHHHSSKKDKGGHAPSSSGRSVSLPPVQRQSGHGGVPSQTGRVKVTEEWTYRRSSEMR